MSPYYNTVINDTGFADNKISAKSHYQKLMWINIYIPKHNNIIQSYYWTCHTLASVYSYQLHNVV